MYDNLLANLVKSSYGWSQLGLHHKIEFKKKKTLLHSSLSQK